MVFTCLGSFLILSSLYVREVINGFSLFVYVSFFACVGGGLFLRVYGPRSMLLPCCCIAIPGPNMGYYFSFC